MRDLAVRSLTIPYRLIVSPPVHEITIRPRSFLISWSLSGDDADAHTSPRYLDSSMASQLSSWRDNRSQFREEDQDEVLPARSCSADDSPVRCTEREVGRHSPT